MHIDLFVFLGVGNKHMKGRKRVLCKSWETQERFYLGRWTHEQDGEAIELAFSKKKIEERKSWLRQFEVKVLACFLLVFLEKVNEYISNITPSECAAWYSPWSDGQAHKIQWLCQQGAYIVFNGRSSEVYSLHGWWPEAWPKENSFLLFQGELCQGSKSCPVFWLCVWAFSLSSRWAESCEYHHRNGTRLCGLQQH